MSECTIRQDISAAEHFTVPQTIVKSHMHFVFKETYLHGTILGIQTIEDRTQGTVWGQRGGVWWRLDISRTTGVPEI